MDLLSSGLIIKFVIRTYSIVMESLLSTEIDFKWFSSKVLDQVDFVNRQH